MAGAGGRTNCFVSIKSCMTCLKFQQLSVQYGSGDNGISRLDHTRLAMDLASVSALRGTRPPSVPVPDLPSTCSSEAVTE